MHSKNTYLLQSLIRLPPGPRPCGAGKFLAPSYCAGFSPSDA